MGKGKKGRGTDGFVAMMVLTLYRLCLRYRDVLLGAPFLFFFFSFPVLPRGRKSRDRKKALSVSIREGFFLPPFPPHRLSPRLGNIS